VLLFFYSIDIVGKVDIILLINSIAKILMAKQSMIQREKKRERLITKYSSKREDIKEQLKTVKSFKERVEIYKKLEKIPRNSSPTRHRNRCWVTGRSRGFYKDFGLSRHVLREMAHEGLIPGLVKSSW